MTPGITKWLKTPHSIATLAIDRSGVDVTCFTWACDTEHLLEDIWTHLNAWVDKIIKCPDFLPMDCKGGNCCHFQLFQLQLLSVWAPQTDVSYNSTLSTKHMWQMCHGECWTWPWTDLELWRPSLLAWPPVHGLQLWWTSDTVQRILN